jgi:nucleotide-binding universal stress UspA family protein
MRVFHRSRLNVSGTDPSRVDGTPWVEVRPTSFLPQRQDSGPVLVAVDGSDRGWEALEWATAEAAARQCVLRIVHVFAWPLTVDALGVVAVNRLESGAREAAELVVERAACDARLIAPELVITTHLQEGAVGSAILREGRRDALIVLGRARPSGLLRPRSGSPAWQVARHAACPVAVIGLGNDAPPGPSAARVVVGVDGTEGSTAALGFAFRAALRRGVGVTALHAWLPRHPADVEGKVDDLDSGQSLRHHMFDAALTIWRDAFPEVDVQPKLVAAPVGPALLAESAAAALLVVGSSGHGRVHGTFFGSVGHTVLRSAHSPVAVVRGPVEAAGAAASGAPG